MISLLLAVFLTQAPPTCDPDGGRFCSAGGFTSGAGLNYGSGTPDFVCGHAGPMEYGGGVNKYCEFESQIGGDYSGYHGDFTLSNNVGRSAGWLFHLNNRFFGNAVFGVDWHGDIWSYGVKGLQVQENGAGLWNQYSYVGVRGNSTNTLTVGDVVVQPYVAHLDGGYVFDVWPGPSNPAFRVRDDGALNIAGKTYQLTVLEPDENVTVLRITYEKPDGGTAVFDVHAN